MTAKNIGFRCPESLALEIKQKELQTGRSKTDIILEMVKGLPSVAIGERKTLPKEEAVYLVWTLDKLLYIGETRDLNKRFKDHHRLVEFLNCDAKIAWFDSTGCDRLEVEEDLIAMLTPELNVRKFNPSRKEDSVKKVSTTIQLDQEARDRLEQLMAKWHLSLAGAVRRLILESSTTSLTPTSLPTPEPPPPPEPTQEELDFAARKKKFAHLVA